jgi:flagellar motor switch protein FliM
MSENLTPEQIAALVEAAKQGELPDSEQPATARRTQRLRTVDFSRPTKFNSDQQRRITRAIEAFCAAAVTRLSAELRVEIELETINSTQVTWMGAQSQLSAGSMTARLEVQPIGTRMVLAAEQQFVLTCLECLLGGTPDRPPRERRLSEIDWVLARRLFESIVHQLSGVWQELAGVSLAVEEIDEEQNESGQLFSVSEPTFVVVIESRINKQSSTLALLIPWMAIAPIADQVAGRERTVRDADSPEVREIERAMAGVPITLRAEVASVDMAVADVLALVPGSVVAFGTQADQGVSLYAENIKLGRAYPGANGPKRAIQISGMEGRSL